MQPNWFNNSDNINFNINTAYLGKHLLSTTYEPNKHIACFSHVPKTGGTSLESILAKNFLLSEILHINAPDLNKQPEILKLKKNQPRLICGHHPMHGLLYQLLPEHPLFHLTQLRHPVDRILSYYNYVVGKKDHPMHSHTKDKCITEFLQSEPSPELSNGQAKRFSGYLHSGGIADETLFELAQTTLKQCFSLVLTTCLFDEGLLLLKKRLGLKDIYYLKHNVSNQYISRDELSVEDVAMIESMNQADIKLFNWAKKNCLQLIEQELTTDDISSFKTNNQKWAELIQS